MLGWSAVCFCLAILAAIAGLSGMVPMPFGLAVLLSLTGFIGGVVLIFTNQNPPKT